MSKILVIHGPNLNLLGTREPAHYGNTRLADINQRLLTLASESGLELESMQSNAEHVIIECIQSAVTQNVDFIIINPAAFTHTSVAIRDALSAVQIPFVEVHLSNVHKREPFRKHSYFSDLAEGVIAGCGAAGYEFALEFVKSRLSSNA